MKLSIRRALSSRILLTTIPNGFNASLLPIITSNHTRVSLVQASLVAARAAWPAPIFVAYNPALPNAGIAPGIRILSPVPGGTYDYPTFNIKTASLSIGMSANNQAPPNFDFTGSFVGPSGAGLQGPSIPDTDSASINFQHGLISDTGYGYPASVIDANSAGNTPSLVSVYTRGTHRLFPYVQTNNILAGTGQQAFSAVKALDTAALSMTLQSSIANSTAALLPGAKQFAGAECLYVELDVDGDLLTKGQSATTDSFILIPYSAGAGYCSDWDGNFSTTDSNVDSLPNYHGAAGLYIVPFAALRSGPVSNNNQTLPLISLATHLDTVTGVTTVAQVGSVGQIDVALYSQAPVLFIQAENSPAPAANFL